MIVYRLVLCSPLLASVGNMQHASSLWYHLLRCPFVVTLPWPAADLSTGWESRQIASFSSNTQLWYRYGLTTIFCCRGNDCLTCIRSRMLKFHKIALGSALFLHWFLSIRGGVCDINKKTSTFDVHLELRGILLLHSIILLTTVKWLLHALCIFVSLRLTCGLRLVFRCLLVPWQAGKRWHGPGNLATTASTSSPQLAASYGSHTMNLSRVQTNFSAPQAAKTMPNVRSPAGNSSTPQPQEAQEEVVRSTTVTSAFQRSPEQARKQATSPPVHGQLHQVGAAAATAEAPAPQSSAVAANQLGLSTVHTAPASSTYDAEFVEYEGEEVML